MKESLLLAMDILVRHGAKAIVLYGSVARGTYNATSDIDLCVDGLEGESYFKALGECLLRVDFPISVVPLKNTYGYFKQRIFEEGKLIYARPI